ncbi:tetratricopeptide repeat domain protein [Lysobacter enzymogenes]|uniref:Tetratricopeptide repeat domain protein n=1 Tax=Lysobacter enzymogenes TaxID=69 RepID=A0A0S2DNK9_LYSEN|nr:tetratricopeptide repeat protein [Lysobacter enzymogenes]ALN60081.1 tetratricopeptide repeat domain protein [Lysobacter enzymogenes]QCW28092.1 tetratricopeptide repeat protein [Lysobacter enzymogenes]
MRALRTFAALALLALAPAASGCINEVGTDRSGRSFSPDWVLGDFLIQTMTPEPPDPNLAARRIAAARARPDFANLNDLGVLLIRQGKPIAAAELFVAVEKLYPGRAATAANLGTALELMGRDAAALRWIRMGIERDANEHARSEWLHVRILEAKIAAAKDPGWLQRHSILGLEFSSALVPPFPTRMPAGNAGSTLIGSDLDSGLSYQLHERVQFVKPPDPVVASLFRDWAILHLSGGAMENADALYTLAFRYGAPRDALSLKRQAHARQVVARARKQDERYGADCKLCDPPFP